MHVIARFDVTGVREVLLEMLLVLVNIRILVLGKLWRNIGRKCQSDKKGKGKGVSRQAEVAQGVPVG
jgi:hypothetical protein